MKTLFSGENTNEIYNRISKLTSNSSQLWGKMNVSQMLAHCSFGLEAALGLKEVKSYWFLNRIIGPLIKRSSLREKPLPKNLPTAKEFITERDVLNFEEEKKRLFNLISLVQKGGENVITKNRHAFFGSMTPQEWSRQQWQHIDHHLQQFGV